MTDNQLPFEWQGRIAPDALSLDDFQVTTPSGATIRPHAGEVVWCRPYGSTISRSLATVGSALEAFRGAAESDQGEDIEAACLQMADTICDRAVAWTLTDPYSGEAYPQPAAGPRAVYDALPSTLFLWLFSKLAGLEDTTARGNGFGGSGATSSAKTGPRSLRRAKS